MGLGQLMGILLRVKKPARSSATLCRLFPEIKRLAHHPARRANLPCDHLFGMQQVEWWLQEQC
jgi:hypothetical protein